MLSKYNNICKVLEQIIGYNSNLNELTFISTIMEKAVRDLNDLFNHWNNSEPEHFIDDVYSHEKVLYLLIQSMNLILTLHKENVCCGDFKPHNCLLFHTYTLKLGDFGGCVKITGNCNSRRSFT